MDYNSSYFVYFFLLFSLIVLTGYKQLYSFGYSTHDQIIYKVFIGFSLLIISVFVGFRYDVGVDWYSYILIFEKINKAPEFSFSDQYYEFGFYVINRIAGNLDFGYQFVFFSLALITWFFFFKSIPKYLLPAFIFFLFCDEYFFWGMNGVRQFVSMAIWVYSIRFIAKQNVFLFLAFIGLASLFHSSSLLLIPLYFVPYDKIYNYRIFIFIYILSFTLSFIFEFSSFLDYFEYMILYLSENISVVKRYSSYLSSGNFGTVEINTGYGFYFRIIVNFGILVFSKKLLEFFPRLRIHICLFFLGSILFMFFYDLPLVGRLNTYFLILRPFILAHVVFVISRFFLSRVISYTIILLYFVLFIASIYLNSNSCCPYQMSF